MLISFFSFKVDIDIFYKKPKFCWKLRHNLHMHMLHFHFFHFQFKIINYIYAETTLKIYVI